MTAVVPAAEQSARRLLAISATLGVVGVAFNLDGDGTLPKLLAAVGVGALIWSLHRYGRLGPDEPMTFAEAEPVAARKKKKKKKARAPEEPPPAAESESNDGM
jgi:hypothetical protein